MSRPRIKDVAASAGVSASTVSVVLNEVPGARVSEETRERVLRTARRMGYATNAIARSLRTRRTRTIGFVGDVVATTPYAGRMIQGAQDAAWEAGHLLILVNTGGDACLESRALLSLGAQQVDGIVYAAMYHRVVVPPAVIDPGRLVLLDARPASGSAPHVVPDERGGAIAAVRELVDHGHRRIGFVTDRLDVPAAVGRLAGYRAALDAAGIAFREELVTAEDTDTAGGYRAVGRMLRQPSRPTAVFCFNDRMAMGAYQAAQQQGLRIPEDVSIVGFDDQELIAGAIKPSLTTVALPHYAMGEAAVRTLLSMMNSEIPAEGADGGEPSTTQPRTVMPCPLVRRRSVGPPPR